MAFLSDELRHRILDLLPRYPQQAGGDVAGAAPRAGRAALRAAARRFARSPSCWTSARPRSHDTMTFYGFFRTEENPLGDAALGLPAVSRAAARRRRAARPRLPHARRRSRARRRADGKITVEFAECLGLRVPGRCADDARARPDVKVWSNA